MNYFQYLRVYSFQECAFEEKTPQSIKFQSKVKLPCCRTMILKLQFLKKWILFLHRFHVSMYTFMKKGATEILKNNSMKNQAHNYFTFILNTKITSSFSDKKYYT